MSEVKRLGCRPSLNNPSHPSAITPVVSISCADLSLSLYYSVVNIMFQIYTYIYILLTGT